MFGLFNYLVADGLVVALQLLGCLLGGVSVGALAIWFLWFC